MFEEILQKIILRLNKKYKCKKQIKACPGIHTPLFLEMIESLLHHLDKLECHNYVDKLIQYFLKKWKSCNFIFVHKK